MIGTQQIRQAHLLSQRARHRLFYGGLSAEVRPAAGVTGVLLRGAGDP